MKRILLVVLVLCAWAVAKRIPAEFRLRKDVTSPMRGWIVEYDDDGFRFQAFDGRRTWVRWEDIHEPDAKKLRQKFKLEMTEDERLGLIPGHIIHFRGSVPPLHGLLDHIDEDGTHWVRTEGLLLPYPRDRVDSVEEAKVKEDEVYSRNEVYVRRLQRRPPSTAKEHVLLGDYLYDIGNFEGSLEQYNLAVIKDPGFRAQTEARLAELRDIMEDKAASTTFQKAKMLANLHGRYADAMRLIKDYIETHPGAKRRGFRIIEEIEEKQLAKRQALFHRVKNEEMDRSIRRYLVRFDPDFATARSWITSELAEQVEKSVTERLDLTKEELELFLESKAKGSPHWATYWSGSFVINKRVKLGKSGARQTRGDPDRWWGSYRDVNTRAGWMKAYAAERLDLFEVVMVRTTPCPRCGGKGTVRKMSLTALADGRHEWNETCPRCFGARDDRSVGYK